MTTPAVPVIHAEVILAKEPGSFDGSKIIGFSRCDTTSEGGRRPIGSGWETDVMLKLADGRRVFARAVSKEPW